jgi:Leucine-rich repeat (LRR) protein
MNSKVIGIILVVLVALGAGYFISNQSGNNGSPAQTTSNNTTEPKGSELDLTGQQLTSLPESVLNRTDITSLNLSNNQLTSLPADIVKLTNLRILNVENNRLTSLPAEISQLKNLQEIRANNNRMTSLPNEIGMMTHLKLLDISGNSISVDQVNQLKSNLPDTEIKN